MIDKIKRFLFTEDTDEEEVLDKDFLEDYEEEEEVEKLMFQEPIQVRKEPKLQTPTKNVKEEITKPKMTIDIKVDEPIFKESEVKQSRVLQRREEYEIPQVISPYFGVKGEEVEVENDGVKIIKPVIKKKDSFNSVISPFYGTKETKPFVTQEVKEINIETTPTFFEKNETQLKYETLEEAAKEEVNISLDEIIYNQSEEEDDLIQFSLFGGSEKIQKNEFENEGWKDQKDDDDILPF